QRRPDRAGQAEPRRFLRTRIALARPGIGQGANAHAPPSHVSLSRRPCGAGQALEANARRRCRRRAKVRRRPVIRPSPLAPPTQGMLMLPRILEPEAMDTVDEARDYD